jgi:hypothetical protein
VATTPILPAAGSSFSRYEDPLPFNKRALGIDASRPDRAGERCGQCTEIGIIRSALDTERASRDGRQHRLTKKEQFHNE